MIQSEQDQPASREAELEAALAARFHEIAVLTQMMEEAEARHRIAMATRGDPVGDQERALSPALQRDALINDALFDPVWYLKKHKDVAAAGLDPVDHYLEIGSAEGRDPGPAFSTMAYRAETPDAAQTGWSALGHYLLIGRPAGHVLRRKR